MSDVVNGEDIINIKQFTPVFEEISDDDKAFEHFLQKDISGEDATGRVDYAIKVWKTSSVLPKGSHAILRLCSESGATRECISNK
ncbi:unnamed protein product [Rhizophagus irregularis]|nr:unnamed protein product [Rhizophagus irregularis]